MPINKDDRVFVCDLREYGTVTRTGILGLKKGGSYAISCDSGKNVMYTGKITKHVVSSVSCMNDYGDRYILPIDLKTLGDSCMKDMGLSPLERSKICVKFSKLPDKEHQEYRERYSTIEDLVKEVCRKLS